MAILLHADDWFCQWSETDPFEDWYYEESDSRYRILKPKSPVSISRSKNPVSKFRSRIPVHNPLQQIRQSICGPVTKQ